MLFPYMIYQFSKEIYDSNLINSINFDNDPKFLEKLSYWTASYLRPKMVLRTFELDIEEFMSNEDNINKTIACIKNKSINIRSILTKDFYGATTGKSLNLNKLSTLEIYRYYYRFSVDKLIE